MQCLPCRGQAAPARGQGHAVAREPVAAALAAGALGQGCWVPGGSQAVAGGHGATPGTTVPSHGPWRSALCPSGTPVAPDTGTTRGLSFASIFNAAEQILAAAAQTPGISCHVTNNTWAGQVAVPVGRQEPCHRGTQLSPQGDRGLPRGGVLGPEHRGGRGHGATGLEFPGS